MSTRINIAVDSGGLLNRNAQQTSANRQAKIEKDRTLNISAEGLDQRIAAQTAKGLSVDGQPLYGNNASRTRRIDQKPAANRNSGQETVSAAFLAYAGTDWNRANVFSYEWTGSNQGPSVWLCSLDGSYWLSDTYIPEGISNWSFLTGAGFNGDIGSSVRYDDISSERRLTQRIVFPAGKGNFILVIRYSQAAAANAAYQANDSAPPEDWVVTYQIASDPQEAFFSYYVSEKSVKKIPTPEPVKVFFRRKMPSIVIAEFPGSAGGVNWNASLPFLAAWSLPDPNSGYPSETLDFPLTLDYVGEQPSSIIRSSIMRSSPFIYAMNADTNADINNFPDSSAGSSAWRNSVLDAGRLNATGQLIARPLGVVVNSLTDPNTLLNSPDIEDIDISLYVINGTVYIDWKTPAWAYLSPSITEDLEFWTSPTRLKITGSSSQSGFIFNEPAPMPSSFSEIVTAGKPAAAGVTLLCSDWGMPGYCRQQLLALGFTSADLTP
jgi:hypothetical protein